MCNLFPLFRHDSFDKFFGGEIVPVFEALSAAHFFQVPVAISVRLFFQISTKVKTYHLRIRYFKVKTDLRTLLYSGEQP